MEKKDIPTPPYEGNSLEDHMGFIFLPTDADGTIHAEMTVDHRTCQPYGMLSGGASMALAETLAGHGSRALCSNGEIPCGIQISCNHMGSAKTGTRICASGKLVHKGRTLHLWDITLSTSEGVQVSSIQVMNYIMKK